MPQDVCRGCRKHSIVGVRGNECENVDKSCERALVLVCAIYGSLCRFKRRSVHVYIYIYMYTRSHSKFPFGNFVCITHKLT